MPDRVCHTCYYCNSRFTVVKRKHHCRLCGQVFCSNCCDNRVDGVQYGFTSQIRICKLCYKLMENDQSNNDIILVNKLTEKNTSPRLSEVIPLPLPSPKIELPPTLSIQSTFSEDDDDEYSFYNDDTPQFIQNDIPKSYSACILVLFYSNEKKK